MEAVSCRGEALRFSQMSSSLFWSAHVQPGQLLYLGTRCHREPRYQPNPAPVLRAQTPSPHDGDSGSSSEVLPLSSNFSGVSRIQQDGRIGKVIVKEPWKLWYGAFTGLATVGLAETAHLSRMNLYGGPISCPPGETGCSDVLNSNYATLFAFTRRDVPKVASLQMAVGASIVVTLSVAFGDASSAFARSEFNVLPPLEPEVSTVSGPKELSLAKHLRSIGAKLYGAFWCSHCHEQKQMFGREALKYVEYVECFPEGFSRGIPIAKACAAANIQGFPTWIINGQAFEGEQEFSQLVEVSGFDISKIEN